jgi:O-antigen/teichoic acid export membrane protein
MLTLRSPFSRDFTIILSGHLARLALGFAGSVLVARRLGPDGYGLISLVLAIVGITLTVADLGLRHTAVRTLSRDLAVDPARSARVAASYLGLLVSINVVAMVIAATVAHPLCEYLLGRPDAAPPFRLALLGAVPAALSGAVAAMLQARRQFWRLAAAQTAAATGTLVGIVMLFELDGLTVQSVIVLGVLAPLIGAAVAVGGIPRAWMAGIGEWPRVRRDWGELFRFSKWLWLSAVCSLLASQLDLLLVNRWTTAHAAGVYALAFNLANRLDVLNQTRFTVRMPVVSSLRTKDEVRAYAREALTRGTVLGVLLVAAAAAVAKPFIVGVYGAQYAESVPVFLVLLATVLVDFVTTPLLILGFPLNAPRTLAASDVIRVAVLGLVAVWLVPQTGLMGAAVARLAGKVAGAVFTLTILRLRLGRLRGTVDDVRETMW